MSKKFRFSQLLCERARKKSTLCTIAMGWKYIAASAKNGPIRCLIPTGILTCKFQAVQQEGYFTTAYFFDAEAILLFDNVYSPIVLQVSPLSA
jgi:hypothetical protein